MERNIWDGRHTGKSIGSVQVRIMTFAYRNYQMIPLTKPTLTGFTHIMMSEDGDVHGFTVRDAEGQWGYELLSSGEVLTISDEEEEGDNEQK